MIPFNRPSIEEKPRKRWDYPWKFAESFIIAIEILLAGIVVEIITGGKGINIPGIPMNIIIFIVLAVILLIIHLRFWESNEVKWISSIPASISAISIYAFLILLLGFIPQDAQHSSKFLDYTGLSHIKSSWPFLLIQFYLLVVLGMVTLRRAIPFKKKNIGFLLNHFGLWLTLLAAGLGSADLKIVTFNLTENDKQTNIAVSQLGEQLQMPFSLELLDFNVVQYDPKLVIVDIKTNKLNLGKKKLLPTVSKKLKTDIDNWQIRVVEYFPNSNYNTTNVPEPDSVGSFAAAFVEAINIESNDTVNGWITSGSLTNNPKWLILDESDVLTFTKPDPKKFSSKLIAHKDQLSADTVILEVNKPYSVNGWKIYQSGYNEGQGRLSTMSIVEAVKDPWLPVVYFGIAFLIAGAFYLFWIGKDRKDKI